MALHPFTPRAVTGERLALTVDDTDRAKVHRGEEWRAEITDQNTGDRYDVRGADCGAGRCFCDAVAVRLLPEPVRPGGVGMLGIPPLRPEDMDGQSFAYALGYLAFGDGRGLNHNPAQAADMEAHGDWQVGWWRAWATCYGEGVKASLTCPPEGEPDPPYPQFSGPWEAWASGCDDEGALPGQGAPQ